MTELEKEIAEALRDLCSLAQDGECRRLEKRCSVDNCYYIGREKTNQIIGIFRKHFRPEK